MKQLKDRKFLITELSLAIICIFTLTIANSLLPAVLIFMAQFIGYQLNMIK